jgi:type I restriction enzyme M protein
MATNPNDWRKPTPRASFLTRKQRELNAPRRYFGNANWTDKAQMPDSTLKNLMEHFSKHDLTLAAVPEDELGNGYEYLIKKFANSADQV